jgi:hypothetical protein
MLPGEWCAVTFAPMPRTRSFPIAPRSTSSLCRGDFWAIPLSDGRFGCAVVTDLAMAGPASRSAFVVGLLEWVGDQPPTASDALTSDIFAQGLTHISAFTKTGAMVLGNVPLPRGLEIPKWFTGGLQAGDTLRSFGRNALAGAIEKHLAGNAGA